MKVNTTKEGIYTFRHIKANGFSGQMVFDGCKKVFEGPELDHFGQLCYGLTESHMETKNGRQEEILGTRRELEIDLNLPKGGLLPGAKFWESFKPVFNAKPKVYNLAVPLLRLEYLFLCAQTNYVANGMGDIARDSALIFVMFSQEDESKARVDTRAVKADAYAKLKELSLGEQAAVLAISNKINTSTLSPTVILDRLYDLIESNARKFMQVSGSTNLSHKVFVMDMLRHNLLHIENDGAIKAGEIRIGYDFDNAVTELFLDKNAELCETLRSDLERLTT